MRPIAWSALFIAGLGVPAISSATSFTERGGPLGVDIVGPGGGVVVADFNEDGIGDILVLNDSAYGMSVLLFSDVAGNWIDVTADKASQLSINNTPRSAIAADFTHDGLIDFVVNDNTRIDFYINNGAGSGYSFGVSGAPNYTIDPTVDQDMNSEGLGWIDYDQNGWLDIIVGDDMRILENPGDGTALFRVIEDGLGLNNSFAHSDYLAVADYDADGFTDVVVRVDGVGPQNRDLYHSDGDGTFTVNPSFDLSGSNLEKGAVIFCDVDGDLDQDIFWSFGVDPPGTDRDANIFYTNDNGLFVASLQPSQPAQAPIDGAGCGDVDNDGDFDLYLAGDDGDNLWRNDGTGNFNLDNGGIGSNGPGESLVMFDADLDGDLDIYTNNDGNNALWVNDTDNDNYLQVRLLADVGSCPGPRILRDDIGATASLDNGPLHEVNGGKGHGSQGWHILHFGLPGGPDEANTLEIRFQYGDERKAPVPVKPSELGVRNYLEVVHDDPDGDEIPTEIEYAQGNGDLDGDGIDNAYDIDADGDGIPDGIEAGDQDRCTPPIDTDGDGAPDYLDFDADGDGVLDKDEGQGDLDGDGVPNWVDPDDGGQTTSAQTPDTGAGADSGAPMAVGFTGGTGLDCACSSTSGGGWTAVLLLAVIGCRRKT